ncbi:MAG TPA: Omp28-related outer membrane protein [Moheibacter sp.]|nr:Omp28-related outer membrane protein [Moheibacter sp.]
MKQLITKLMLLGIAPLATFGYAQTIVSTTPENRKAILEEFTGIHCQYCPNGHKIAEQILVQNPGKAFAINIHQGGFAGNNPDFKTQWGNAIAGQTGLTGYPSGTVNRHVFVGGKTILDYGQWATRANQIMSMPSYVNLGVEATLDIDTGELIVHVEAYYTGDSPKSTNRLNVALLQNNTLGPQTGGGMGNNYNHMRRLVDLLTGQWGEEITTTTQGSFVSKTYTYNIPADYRGVPTVLSNMEIVVFMTETTQEIISGNGTYPSLLGMEFDNEAEIVGVDDIPQVCDGVVSPEIVVKNNGGHVIKTLDIEYSVNSGAVKTYTWNGNIGPLNTTKIILPNIDYIRAEGNVNALNVTIATPDEVQDNNSIDVTFKGAQEAKTTALTLTLTTDHRGVQSRWVIRNSNNTTIKQGSGYGNNQTYTIEIDLPAGDDCYSFRTIDTGGDGGATYLLKDAQGNILSESDGNHGDGYTDQFYFGQLSLADVTNVNAINVYPNPSNGTFNVSSDQKIDNIQVYDITGKLMRTFKDLNTNKTQVELSNFNKGTYILKIQTGQSVTTKKVIIK